MKKICIIFLCVVLLVSLCGCNSEPEPDESFIPFSSDSETLPVAAPKTAFNYLTGEHNMAVDRIGTRPVCVSINNLINCWPQSGLSQADVLIEGLTEGGITRFAALYVDTREVAKISTFRSLRNQLIEASYPLDPIYGSIGHSYLVEDLKEEYDLDILDGHTMPDLYYFDQARYDTEGYASEHCWYTSGMRIYSGILEQGVPVYTRSELYSYFNFASPWESVIPADGDAATVHFYFYGKYYDGDFRYNARTKTYLKFQHGGQPQLDVGTGDEQIQLSFKNVLVLFADIEIIDTVMGVLYVDYQAGGVGYYFSNGKYEEIRWDKPDFESNFVYTKKDGTPLVVNTGKSIICVPDSANLDTLKIA